jgi:hypothetical protein
MDVLVSSQLNVHQNTVWWIMRCFFSRKKRVDAWIRAVQLLVCWNYFNKLVMQSTVCHENTTRWVDDSACSWVSCKIQRLSTPVTGLSVSELQKSPTVIVIRCLNWWSKINITEVCVNKQGMYLPTGFFHTNYPNSMIPRLCNKQYEKTRVSETVNY